jgi:serine/threonine protein kinase
MSTGTQTCDVVLPGYTLVDRIGMGGYAEVWRAEAPGGIQKAVKIVHGYYDDEFACQELKSLERIKGVRHPFLLSLERFEIINGRLTILSELADMSLDQRHRQCRAEGLCGIPRDELLGYMRDAAEALDFLSQRHSLLHLDIKPENLLILGEHIKVADFGLVKEMASRTQNSLVSGMTPTYASPEMFDDDPSAQSDQYSLAIVYQEMLQGTLPFPGRTAAQLAKQHTQSEPQLMSLPPEERPIVARALAKSPTDRYPSCRAFVEALMHPAAVPPSAIPAVPPSATAIEAPQPNVTLPSPNTPKKDDTELQSSHTTLCHPPADDLVEPGFEVTQRLPRSTPVTPAPQAEVGAAAEIPGEETVDIPIPDVDPLLQCEQPTLYVAIGGVGIQVLCRLRALSAARSAAQDSDQAVESIALDTDRDELREACSRRWASPLRSEDTLHLPLRLPQSYDNSREILGWLSRRWLYNIPRSLETRGYRALGRVALVDHSSRVLALIDQKLQQLARVAGTASDSGQTSVPAIRVVLLAGTGGGTGAGTVIDVANAVRSSATGRDLQVEVHGFLVCTCLASLSSSPLAAANTYSLLMELNHAANSGNEGNSGQTSRNLPFESRAAPFDCVYCVPIRARSKDNQTTDALEPIAQYLALESSAGARAAIRTCREAQTPREQSRGRSLSLRLFGLSSLADQKTELLNKLAIELREAIKQHWMTKDNSADWERLVRDELLAARVTAPAVVNGGESEVTPVRATANDSTPLALRGRFKDHMSLEFASEVLRQIQQRLEDRDDRGKPFILPGDAKLIADTARAVTAFLAANVQRESDKGSSFTTSPTLRPLIAEGSRRVISHAVENFDSRHSERFLPVEAVDDLIQTECRALLEKCLASRELAAEITKLLDLDRALLSAIDNVDTDLLQCGRDRRTLVFMPNESPQGSATESLRAVRPLAGLFSVDVDDFVVVSESAGVSPRSVAIGLERVFPGIADAARRLLTRIDIEWQPLT